MALVRRQDEGFGLRRRHNPALRSHYLAELFEKAIAE